MKKILFLLVFLILIGCASQRFPFSLTSENDGSGIIKQEYLEAIDKFNLEKDAINMIGVSWYPNVILTEVLGSLDYLANPIDGVIFLTDQELIFSLYESSQNLFLQAFSAKYGEIRWMMITKWGGAKIIQLQSNNNINSFIYDRIYKKIEGKWQLSVIEDEFIEFLSNKRLLRD